MKKRWKILNESLPKSVEEVRDILLHNREIDGEEQFLKPKHPKDFTLRELNIDESQIKKTLDRIEAAKANGEAILIFGDYDADGISATAILWQTLHHLGYEVLPFIPHREKHGYGISNAAIDEMLAGSRPGLIITVDNGIVAHEPVRRLMVDEKIDVIVTDHHQPEEKNGKVVLPGAFAVVHTTDLCGAGVSWILSKELDPNFAADQLDLAGIATIADQVPLKGANRSFARWGIEAVKNSKRVGLNKLLDAAKVDRDKISSNTVGFAIAPRINAMGRLKHGLDALRLLCTNNSERASKLVAELTSTNVARQDMTADFLVEAISDAEKQRDEKLIITASDQYHEGVIGLIAGRLTEKYHKPAIAISLNGEVSKSSARSVPGVNIIEFLRTIQEELLEVGGHPMAAGFSFESKKIEEISKLLFDLGREQIDKELLIPAIEIDTEIPWELVGNELMEVVENLSPFGQANPRPLFKLSDLQVQSIRTMGRENEHLKLVASLPNATDPSEAAKTLNILGWKKGSLASNLSEGEAVSVAGVLELNHWNGRTEVQMVLRDLVTAC